MGELQSLRDMRRNYRSWDHSTKKGWEEAIDREDHEREDGNQKEGERERQKRIYPKCSAQAPMTGLRWVV